MIHDPETGLYLPATRTEQKPEPEPETPESEVPDRFPASWLGGPEDTAPIDIVDQTQAEETSTAAEPAEPVENSRSEPQGKRQDEPELVRPERPTPDRSAITRHASRAFQHLVWLAVIAGLAGQIVGWSAVFGDSPAAIGVSATLGAAFELIMVAASSRGLEFIGEDRPKWQPAVLLTIGTACAALAVGMILSHFTGPVELIGLAAADSQSVGLAAAACCVVGYTAHLVAHLPDELQNRKDMQAWKVEDKRIKAELDVRTRRRLALRDEVEEQRLRATVTTTPAQPPTADPEPEPEPVPAPKPTPAKAKAKSTRTGSSKPAKADAVAFACDHGITTGPELRDAMREAGWDTTAPSRQSWHNWAREAQS